MSKYEKSLIIPDIHAPFEDLKALEACIHFTSYWKPDRIFIIGDLVDFYAVSRFVKDPERSLNLQEELDRAYDVLEVIRRVAPKAKITLIRGNHEYRLQKYLWSRAQELNGLRELRVEKLLNLDKLKISYESTGRLTYNGIVIKHGDKVRKWAGYSARAEFENAGLPGISGHTHRGSIYYQKNASGDYAWMEVGCLCRLDAEYLEGETPNWIQGWGLLYSNPITNRYFMEFVPFVGGKAFYENKEFPLYPGDEGYDEL